jgi:hypothetical protein
MLSALDGMAGSGSPPLQLHQNLLHATWSPLELAF